jgi:UDP-N-acetylmuramoylalanine--D-glutamate ligase
VITPGLDRADVRRFVVVGLARSGLSTVKALLRAGMQVTGWDDNAAAREAASALGISIAPLAEIDWQNVWALVLSPGVPLHFPTPSPWAEAARAAAVPIIGDIELFALARAKLPMHKVIGITGTNGKSTTTALIAHILSEAGMPNCMGGNIGLPVLDQVPLAAGGVYVLELSSFQIDLLQTLECDVAVLTNITPDHLDRHGDMTGYAAAKSRLFALQDSEAVSVVSIDDELSRGIYAIAPVGRVAISVKSVLTRGVCVVGGVMTVDNVAVSSQTDWPSLQGPHNAQNAAAAVAAARAVGVPLDKAVAALRTFGGLEHRMERIRTLNGVLYVNDSKATNADSTAPALAAYPAIQWIAGGKRKTDDLDACLPWLKNVRAAWLIGDAAAVFADILSPHVPVTACGTLDIAVQKASAAAKAGDVVLLSPACASQDQFRDYEQRGNLFRSLVGALS